MPQQKAACGLGLLVALVIIIAVIVHRSKKERFLPVPGPMYGWRWEHWDDWPYNGQPYLYGAYLPADGSDSRQFFPWGCPNEPGQHWGLPVITSSPQ